MAASVLSEQARVELARAVLAHAELRTGARSVRVGTRPAEPSASPAAGTRHGSETGSTPAGGAPVPFAADPVRGATRPSSGLLPTHRADRSTASATPGAVPTDRAVSPHGVPVDHTASPHTAPADRTLSSRAADEAWARSHPTTSVPRPAGVLAAERPPLPVPDRLAPLLPDGLRRGATTAVVGSTSLVLAMLAHACAGGAWAAVVGQPTVGLLAAAEAGVALERLALVPRPGQDAATVVAALVDGIDVVLVGPDTVLTDTDRRRLSARARDRGAVLLSSVAWPGASTVLTVEAGRWWGVGAGDGRLRTHELRVTRSGRGGSAVPLSVDVTLPLSADSPSVPVAPPAATVVPPEVVDEQQPAVGLRLVG
ncbi:hypothetical protein ACFO3K_19750 [Cellulomonas algicola]|uniref:hypothetical protein n=1 Tax=Cellulomonas algicola TaxID=2071633 RepID=UPI001CED6C7A|nr:hypothetical protein [Cellulomonas algicola]